MTAVAGYTCLVRKSGTSTAVTTEPVSILAGGSSLIFRITSAAKRVIDPEVDWSFVNGATTIAYTAIGALDYMNGEVTFLAAQSAGSVTSLHFNGSYLPITTSSDLILDSRSFKLSESADLLDTTVFTGTPTLNIHSRLAALKDVSLDVESLAKDSDLIQLASTFQGGAPVVTEVYFGSDTAPRFRGICLISNIDEDGSVEGLVKTNLGFKIAAIRNATAGLVAGYTFKAQPA